MGGFTFLKEDRRVRKTKSAIKHAFIQLLKEQNITVQDIADKADIILEFAYSLIKQNPNFSWGFAVIF